MERWVSPYAKISIINRNGIKKPDISDVEIDESEELDKIRFEGSIEDLRINKCRCKSDEIILEIFHPNKNKRKKYRKPGLIRIHTAYNAPHMLYKKIVQLANQLNYKLAIKYCENNDDLFHLDKVVQMVSKSKKEN